MSAVVLFVELKLNPGRRDAFVARATRHRALVLAGEPGCRRFDVSVPDKEEDTVCLYEVYEDEAAFDHHMGTDYMAEYRADTAPMAEYRADTAPMVAERVLRRAALAHD